MNKKKEREKKRKNNVPREFYPCKQEQTNENYLSIATAQRPRFERALYDGVQENGRRLSREIIEAAGACKPICRWFRVRGHRVFP